MAEAVLVQHLCHTSLPLQRWNQSLAYQQWQVLSMQTKRRHNHNRGQVLTKATVCQTYRNNSAVNLSQSTTSTTSAGCVEAPRVGSGHPAVSLHARSTISGGVTVTQMCVLCTQQQN